MTAKEIRKELNFLRPSWSGALEFLFLAVLIYLAFFFSLGDLPIYVWDEARDASNALEMLRTGDLLVTYFHGHPEFWNTKPPGAIWLMAGSMRLFGVSEFALRLPSALAGAGTAAMLYVFTRGVTGSRWAGLIAAAVLTASAGYVGPHVTRTADYDALLVLFTTAAALAFHLALETQGERSRWMLVGGAATSLAILVKGVAGVLLLPGLAVFALATGRLPTLLRSRGAWAGAAVVVVLVGGFYLLREHATPGYLKAVAANELGGRFAGSIEGHGGPWYYYLAEIVQPWPLWLRWPPPESQVMGSAFPWSWLFPLSAAAAVTSRRSEVRSAALMLLVVSVVYLVIISSAATKLTWYLAPVVPFVAIMTALGAQRSWEWLAERRPRAAAVLPALYLALACVVTLGVVYKNHREIRASPNRAERMTAAFVKEVFAARPRLTHVRIVHNGHGFIDGRPYTAPEEFYAAALRQRGLDVSVVQSSYAAHPGETLLVCSNAGEPNIAQRYDVILQNRACKAMEMLK